MLWLMLPDRLSPREFLDSGDQWTDRIARLALPVLLGRAKAGSPVTYKELAHRLYELYDEREPKAYRNYGDPIGKIGDALEALSIVWKSPIPPLSAIVINGTTRLPGNGAYSFIQRYLKQKIQPSERSDCARMAWKRNFEYPKWDSVASYFGSEIDTLPHEPEISPIRLPDPARFKSAPEGPAHKALKEWVRIHPEIFQEDFGTFPAGVKEKVIQSGDRLDVYFQSSKTFLAAEVKDGRCHDSELYRGVFQCVKYRSVLRATQLACGEIENAQAVLVTQRSLPSELVRLAQILNVIVLVV